MKKFWKTSKKAALSVLLALCMSVTVILAPNFSVSAESVTELPFCEITHTDAINVTFGDEESKTFKFTTAEAGDYSLNFDEIHAYVGVFNSNENTWVYESVDSEWLDVDGDWFSRSCLVFNLEAQTTYYFKISTYSASETRISVTKNAKTIEEVELVPPAQKISPFDFDVRNSFSCRIIYTDSSRDVFNYFDAAEMGVIVPEVRLANYGTYVPLAPSLLPGGKQLAVADYRYKSEPYYIEIEPLYEHLISEGYNNLIGEYNSHRVSNPGDESYYFEYVRVKVANTGLYGFLPNELYGSSLEQLRDGYIQVIDSRNQNVEAINDNTWPLVAMEEYVVIFTYAFAEGETDDFVFYPERVSNVIFPDTASGQWYSDAVAYTVGSGIMTGYSNGKFGTSDSIQRQDFLVMLARMAKIEEGWYKGYNPGKFTDFNMDSYYAYAVNWGYESRIVTGYLDGRFGIGDVMTREQLVTFLYRYAQSIGHDVGVSPVSEAEIRGKYADFGSVSDFAEDAILWAIDRGVIKGKTANTIVPQGNAQRCEVAQIMYNIFKNEIF